MLNVKRIVIATIGGVLAGLACFGLASSGPSELPTPVTLQIITSRTLIGFAIGVSCWRMFHWSLHGLAMGLLFSLPLALSGLMAPDNPEFSKTAMFVSTIVMGMIYGLLIELFTSVVFKARVQAGKPAEAT